MPKYKGTSNIISII